MWEDAKSCAATAAVKEEQLGVVESESTDPEADELGTEEVKIDLTDSPSELDKLVDRFGMGPS